MWEVGDDVIAIQYLALQGGCDINTIHRVVRRYPNVQLSQDGRVEVQGLNNCVAARTGFGDARPSHHAGYTNAAFEHGGFAPAQGGVARRAHALHYIVHVAAVVGDDHNGSAVGNSGLVYCVEQSVDGISQDEAGACTDNIHQTKKNKPVTIGRSLR